MDVVKIVMVSFLFLFVFAAGYAQNETAVCGDGACSNGEDSFNCEADCGPPPSFCGDGTCDLDENSFSCQEDCGAPEPYCGNEVCDTNEDEFSCPEDCPSAGTSGGGGGGQGPPVEGYCGDGFCDESEEEYCFEDCPSAGTSGGGGGGQTPYCGDYSCDIGEDEFNCPNDCSSGIPEGCYEEEDESGFIHVICEDTGECPELDMEERIQCMDSGGSSIRKTDSSGCEYYECVFPGQPVSGGGGPGIPWQPHICPSPEDIKDSIDKCAEINQQAKVYEQNGCQIVKCLREREQFCPHVGHEDMKLKQMECESRGLHTTHGYDEQGCFMYTCIGDEDYCRRDPPAEAYTKCDMEGGELIVKRDEHGCVVFDECVNYGDYDDVYYEEIEDVPDTTELLEIAFKLEELRISLDQLAFKTEDIANYYASVGSSDEERYRRVSDMFFAAKDEIDRIKLDIRERLDHITIGDLRDFKHDIKYIKDVILKDILYIMLSESNDVREIEKRSASDCGSDGGCFDRAFRVCKEGTTFHPEGREGPIVTVEGLRGDLCFMHVEMPFNPDIYMDCGIQKYALGIRNPETDVFPYCEGPMVDMLEEFGPGGPGGPGGCQSDRECDEYCRDNIEECIRWCDEHPGVCPEEPQEFREEYREEFPEYRGEPRPYEEYPEPSQRNFEREFREEAFRESCGGCLDNDICDVGECSYCFDCSITTGAVTRRNIG